MLNHPCSLCSVHTGLLMLLYPFVPETPYWLVHQGDVAGADAVLHKMAQVNGVSLPKVTLPPTTPLNCTLLQDIGHAALAPGLS